MRDFLDGFSETSKALFFLILSILTISVISNAIILLLSNYEYILATAIFGFGISPTLSLIIFFYFYKKLFRKTKAKIRKTFIVLSFYFVMISTLIIFKGNFIAYVNLGLILSIFNIIIILACITNKPAEKKERKIFKLFKKKKRV